MAGAQVMRRLNNDSLTNWYGGNIIIWGDNAGHFAGYSLSPIVVPPGGQRAVYVAIACSDTGEPLPAARAVYARRADIEQAARLHAATVTQPLGDTPFRFSQERLRAQIFSNVIYPEGLSGQMVRTYVPGKTLLIVSSPGTPACTAWGVTEYSPETGAGHRQPGDELRR